MWHGHGTGTGSLHVSCDNRCTHHAGKVIAQAWEVVAEAVL